MAIAARNLPKPLQCQWQLSELTCSVLSIHGVAQVALVVLRLPNVLLLLQFASSALFAYVTMAAGWVESDPLTWENVKASLLVVFCFFAGIFTNLNALHHINVDTMIMFKTCTPFAISILQWVFMGYELPSLRTWGALSVVAGSAGLMLSTDLQLSTTALLWVAAWVFMLCFDAMYLKHYTNTVKLTPLGRVLYNNLLSCVPAAVCILLFGEHRAVIAWFQDMPDESAAAPGNSVHRSDEAIAVAHTGTWHEGMGSAAVVAHSCVAGFAMSWVAWALRAEVSALTFTVIGVLNKLLSIAINAVIWSLHSGTSGTIAVAAAILAGTLYQEPKLASRVTAAPKQCDGVAEVPLLGSAVAIKQAQKQHPQKDKQLQEQHRDQLV
jgi:GDP-mannose transporter